MTTRPRFFLGLLVASGALVSTVATGEPPKVSGPAAPSPQAPVAPSKVDLRAKTTTAPASLAPEQRANVQKAVKAGIAAYAKTKSPSKAYAAGVAGLRGTSLLSYRAQMTAYVSANTKAAVRYSIEGGSATVTPAGNCTFTIDAALLVKNKLGGDFPADRPAPSLEAVTLPSDGISWTDPGAVIATVALPRLAANQAAVVHLVYSRGGGQSGGACLAPTSDAGLNVLGVASNGVYVLRLFPGGAELETYPLGTTPSSESDYPSGFPGGGECGGWKKCADGTCTPQAYPCDLR